MNRNPPFTHTKKVESIPSWEQLSSNQEAINGILNSYTRGFFLVLFLILSGNLSAQQTSQVDSYEIKVAGFKIGELEARHRQNGNEKHYFLQSEVSFWFFGRIFLNHEIQCEYQENQLISSLVTSQSNRGDFVSKIQWNKDHYVVDAETYKYENSQPISQIIEGSTSKFYFEKPKDGDEVLSETFGVLSKVREIEKDIFEIEINGNRNRFFYSGEELMKVLIQNPIKNYVLERVK